MTRFQYHKYQDKTDNSPAEISVSLKSPITTKSNLVYLDSYYILGDAWQLSPVPNNTSDDQVTAMQGFDSTTEK